MERGVRWRRVHRIHAVPKRSLLMERGNGDVSRWQRSVDKERGAATHLP